MVYKNKISPFGVKFEGPGGNPAFELLVTNTKINEWETLTFDFSSRIGQTVSRIVLLPDFLIPRASGGTVFIDNISFGDGTTSVNSLSADVGTITCYPNPVLNQLTVNANSDISEVIVRNLLGQAVRTVVVNNTQATLDMSQMPAGNYFVTTKLADGGISTQKVVKQ